MKTAFTITLAFVFGVVLAFATPPTVPRTNEVIRYERLQPVFQTRAIPRDKGDLLLTILDGGRALHKQSPLPPHIVCDLPEPARLWMDLVLANDATNHIGFTRDGGMVYLDHPVGLFVLQGEARAKTGSILASLDADLRREAITAKKPCKYKIGTIADAWSLSDVARLFYGDASKWRAIYEANRAVIKNPNLIQGNETLTIPELR